MSTALMGRSDQDSIGTISPLYQVNYPGGIPTLSDLNEVVTNLNINVVFSHNRNINNNSDKNEMDSGDSSFITTGQLWIVC